MVGIDSVDARGEDFRTVVHTTAVATRPLVAWRAWTSSEALTGWWPVPRTTIDLRVGGAFELHFDPAAPPGSQGSEGCRFLGYVPGEMLSFTWNAPPHLVLREHHTWVVLTFTLLGEEATAVQLVHAGFGDGPDWDAYRDYFASAWGRVLELFVDHFGNPEPVGD